MMGQVEQLVVLLVVSIAMTSASCVWKMERFTRKI